MDVNTREATPDEVLEEDTGSSPQGNNEMNTLSQFTSWLQQFHIICDLVRGFFRLLPVNPRRFVTESMGDVMSFVQNFEERYGYEHPTFYMGSYSQALDEAKQELKFLLVYLHCDDHQNTPQFCTETLCNEDVINYIDSNMLFWACSVTLREGYCVSQALRENEYPFLVLIGLIDGRMIMVGRTEGLIGPHDLVFHLNNLVEENEIAHITARAERFEHSFNQTLRQLQDEAYMESLRADQEKERRHREEQERRENEVLMERQHQIDNEKRRETIAKKKVEFSARIPEEPTRDDPESVHIVIKLPNGTRLERRFLKSHSLKDLYYYLFCHPESPYSFEITTNFPKRVLKCQEDKEGEHIETIGEAGLSCKEVLFVHDLEA